MSSPSQMAENSIMMGRAIEAETILLHNKNIFEAVEMFMRLHQWERALNIAQDAKDVEQVLGERKKYLKALDREEYSQPFLNFKK